MNDEIRTIPQLNAMIADKNARLAEQGRLQDAADQHLADSKVVTILDNDISRIDELISDLKAHGSKFSWECANTMNMLQDKCAYLDAEVSAYRQKCIDAEDRLKHLKMSSIVVIPGDWKS